MPNQENVRPSPELFFSTINAHQRTAALKAAIELKVFSAIGKDSLSANEIASKCNASEKGIRVLCDFLTILGFLKKENFQYRLTTDSAMFLDRNSRAYIGETIHFLLSPTLISAFEELTSAVSKGGTALPEGGSIAPNHPVWVIFAKAMAPIARVSAELIADMVMESGHRPKKVLDIAAGHGLFGITIAQRNTDASILAVDWPGVLEVAKQNAAKAAVSNRYNTRAGSAFDTDFGEGYDLVLLTNFLHHADIPSCEKLLRKIYASMVDGGKVFTLEFVPNEDRISPEIPAMFSLVMLATTQAGDAYTFSEYQRMFSNAGFARSEVRALPIGFEQVIISHK